MSTPSHAPIRPLTPKQRRFVQLILAGHGKSEAYRMAYHTHADSHTVSVAAGHAAKRPAVQAVFAMAKNGDLAGLLSCGVNPDFLALKKLLALSNDPSVRPYVQVRALHAAQKYRFHLEQEGKREAETAEKVTSEELEKLLLDTQKGTPAGLEWDDDLSLDLDARPITSPKSEVTPKESPIRGSLQHGRNGLRGYEAPDPFMTRSTVPERVLHLTSTHPRFRNNS